MCGIFGAFGQITIDEALKCLKRLEYRGYDSAGISYGDDNIIVKSIGRISELSKKVQNISTNKIICHTRWATNGAVTTINAHPHISKNGIVTLVHNGVLENEDEITKTYLSNYSFTSDTDSEKIACLIEIFLKDNSPMEAIRKTMEIIKGSYAILLMIKGNNAIYYMKKNSSLILAYDDKNTYLSSDLYALPSTVKKYKHIANMTYGIISEDMRDSDEGLFDFDFYESSETKDDMMIKEIKEELTIIERLEDKIDSYLKIIEPQLSKASELVIIGSGSSYYAALYIEKLANDILKKRARAFLASEFIYNSFEYNKNTLYILISQSGETADLILVNNTIPSQNKILFTNNISSRLGTEIPMSLDILAGQEIGVAATKSFNQTVLLAYMLFTKYIGNDFLDLGNYKKSISYFIENKSQYINDISNSNKVFYIGKGYDYIVAQEASLKLKEISYISSWGYQSGELKHGSLALVDENTFVIGLSSSLKSYMLHSLNEVKARNGKIALVEAPFYSKYLGALSLATFSQLIAYYVAKNKNLDPDHPRNLAKSVTVI